MTITFFGHSKYYYNEYEESLLKYLGKVISGKTTIYLGGYGNFDAFALHCCTSFKKLNMNYEIEIVHVVPYYNEKEKIELYDSIMYPQIENVPKKFAII